MNHTILNGDCIEMLRTLPDGSVHCVVTSPPYWGLRDYQCDGQVGLEDTPDAYVARMVEVFREVRRVLRDDGTLWLNIGDSYAAARGGTHQPAETLAGGVGGLTTDGSRVNRDRHDGYNPSRNASAIGLKHKDLVGIPWRLAFALQADGWYLRQDIIWAKPNPMPESVRDRCTKAHEYVFLLTKEQRYFYDSEAVAEKSVTAADGRGATDERRKAGHPVRCGNTAAMASRGEGRAMTSIAPRPCGRNRRSVWTITTKPYKGAHFATMPPRLAELCILAGTSAEGCCAGCGAPFTRVTERTRVPTRPGVDTKVTKHSGHAETPGWTNLHVGNRDPKRHVTKVTTTGWQPSCKCGMGATPCTVLDPFGGSGTTLAVAAWLGRSGVMCELNPDYVKLAEDRIAKETAKTALFK